jgi:ribosomal 30S subunit maturation factor RimM
MKGLLLYIPAKDRPDLSDDDAAFYIQELVGLEVYHDNVAIGRVIEVCDTTGTHDWYEMNPPQKRIPRSLSTHIKTIPPDLPIPHDQITLHHIT